MTIEQLIEDARALIRAEGEVIAEVADQIDASFADAVELLAHATGVVMVTGAGTSGTIARRMAHLFATTGLHAFYVSSAEALHGPSAAVAEGDVLIALSKAGKSAEINQFVGVARARGARVISLTWEPESELAQLSDVVLVIRPDVRGEGEGVLPFASTLANGAVGDALCLAVKRLRGFDLATLVQTHPSGATSELVRPEKP
ncbi:MAG: SIS domain-containing protein [Caldilineaceae bacterium]|nr:SIS domain-containing protein [Caldilineaceae bacterium]